MNGGFMWSGGYDGKAGTVTPMTTAILSSAIAHELRQPLAAISSDAGAALRWLSQDPPNIEEATRTLRRIQETSLRSDAVISAIRAMQRHDPALDDLLDVNWQIKEAVKAIEANLSQHQIALRLRLEPSLPHVRGRAIPLQQVVINLLMNAAQAVERRQTGGPGWIQVESGYAGGTTVAITVRDSGSGIAPEILPRIFDPYFTTRADGVGLGLALCRLIVEQHGGKIEAANSAGAGAEIRLLLPFLMPVTRQSSYLAA